MNREDDTKKSEIVAYLDEMKPHDVAKTIIKSVLSVLPIGGALTELIDLTIPDTKEKRLKAFVAQMKVDIERLADKIKVDVINTKEFAFMFEQTFRAVSENYQQEKLDAFRAILINSMIKVDVQEEQKELFLITVKGLGVLHLRLLKVLYNPQQYMQDNGIILDNTNTLGWRIITYIKNLFPQFDESQLRIIVRDLYNSGLSSIDPSSLETKTNGGSNQLANRLTDFGRALVDFIRLDQ